MVLLSSHCQSVFSTFPALPGNKIKLKVVMDGHAVKIFVWIIKFCVFCTAAIQTFSKSTWQMLMNLFPQQKHRHDSQHFSNLSI